MLSLDPNLVCHMLNTQPEIKPIVQQRRNFHLKIEAKIKVEVEKLLVAGFMKSIKHPFWLANIVPAKKKNTVQIWICIDYRDLHAACLKDEFPLPNIDIKIDSTSGLSTLDPDKVRTIRVLMPLLNAKKLKSLMGKPLYIQCFILGLAAIIRAFAQLLRKWKKFVWTKEYEEAYQRVQQLVTNLPIMKASVPSIPFKLYLVATSTAVGALLA
ncbi:hypothetical protein D8674_008761 [Pyrus ussuriensis x Pyrus communis]|uniref:Uncharacterized protein n=1 Tax=Pyrus ussuriensis x Pyrus communis TaxID=2448454 RepID=A0A5N5HYH6_9ROSA|nr:hypothetical protein D8674_008761 [Pyrus ussuriensis x Pyrus communis]